MRCCCSPTPGDKTMEGTLTPIVDPMVTVKVTLVIAGDASEWVGTVDGSLNWPDRFDQAADLLATVTSSARRWLASEAADANSPYLAAGVLAVEKDEG